jgi:hypothetical protein
MAAAVEIQPQRQRLLHAQHVFRRQRAENLLDPLPLERNDLVDHHLGDFLQSAAPRWLDIDSE